jgi:hypothetical protein
LRHGSAGEFAGLVAEEGGFDEGADDVLFVGVELVEGGEVVFEVGGERSSSLARESMLVARLLAMRRRASRVGCEVPAS